MKKIFGFVILIGFVIMLGAAGSADAVNMSFGKVLALELLGMAVSFFGMVALSHYKCYLRRRRKTVRNKSNVKRVRMAERELA